MDLYDSKLIDVKIESMKLKIEADLVEPGLQLVFGQLKKLAASTSVEWDDALVSKMEAAVRASLEDKAV